MHICEPIELNLVAKQVMGKGILKKTKRVIKMLERMWKKLKPRQLNSLIVYILALFAF